MQCGQTSQDRPLGQQRAARRLDQLRVRGDPFVLHPRAAVDLVPGGQPRHGGAAQVFKEVLDSTAHRLRSGDVGVRVEGSLPGGQSTTGEY